MNFTKNFFGWVLLLAGIFIIFYALYSSFNIFTAKTPAPEIFKIESQTAEVQGSGVQGVQAQMQEMVQEQLKGILPADSLPQLLNLIAWSVLAGILIFGGAQISSLGIKLLRTPASSGKP